MEERNSASSPPLESFRPIDDRSAAQVLVSLWKACFQQMLHRVEGDVEGEISNAIPQLIVLGGGGGAGAEA
ncbi:hypothetical protein JG687_00016661 [Phytophthora cactorum]|uniref:Uncharacterized protein n=1 Tax=Phytophthora cactorum TaxID=29920 RepID=A0A8T1TQ57_9STRA|nr:hypothetical protein JG687_00016661 [Phytophthora cactorum]